MFRLPVDLYTQVYRESVHAHCMRLLACLIYCSSLPIECLHTILLGPYKYMVADLVGKLTPLQKEEVLARIQAFDFSDIHGTLPGSICRYNQSFLGRDFKTWAQICLFIVWDFLTVTERAVCINLSKVHNVNYFIYALI